MTTLSYWDTLLTRWFVPLCFIIYMALRIALIALPIDQHSDSLWYFNRALAIAAGDGYSERGFPTAYWPVGWPGVLGILFSVFGPFPVVAQLANVFFSAVTFVLTLRLGEIIFKDGLVGRLSVLTLTFYPNQIAYVPILATETFYTALLLFAIYIMMRGEKVQLLIVSGLVFGIATLTKTQSFLIPIVVLGVWAYNGRWALLVYLKKLAVLGMAMIVVLLPWTYRNYLVFHDLVIVSTNGGATLLTGNNPSANGDYTPDDALVKRVPHSIEFQVQEDRLATTLALEWITTHPGDFALLIPKKVWRLWAPDGEAEWAYQAGFKNYDKYVYIFRVVRGVNQIYYFCIMLAFAVSAYYIWQDRREDLPYRGTAYALVAYFTLISMIFSGQSRFHFILMPWIVIYASYAVLQWLRDRSPPRTAP